MFFFHKRSINLKFVKFRVIVFKNFFFVKIETRAISLSKVCFRFYYSLSKKTIFDVFFLFGTVSLVFFVFLACSLNSFTFWWVVFTFLFLFPIGTCVDSFCFTKDPLSPTSGLLNSCLYPVQNFFFVKIETQATLGKVCFRFYFTSQNRFQKRQFSIF